MKHSILLGLFLAQMSFAAESTVVLQSNDERLMALYAMVDIDVANAYLKPQGLEAVDIGGGKALTGFLAACYNNADLPQVGLKLERYCETSLPMLVTKPGTEVQGGYLFSRIISDNEALATASHESGMSALLQVAGITISDLSSSEPNAQQSAEVVMTVCPKDDASCVKGQTQMAIVMGASKKEEIVVTNDKLENWFVSDLLPSIGHPVARFEASGDQFTRPFDPARDSYYVAPESPQAAVINHASFQPTVWVTGTGLSLVVKDMQIIK